MRFMVWICRDCQKSFKLDGPDKKLNPEKADFKPDSSKSYGYTQKQAQLSNVTE